MNHEFFQGYFTKRLSTNPYFDEVMKLLDETYKKKIAEETKEDVKHVGVTKDTIAKYITDEYPAVDYRISTMTCIYSFGVELNEYSLYEVAPQILKESVMNYEEEKSNFKIIGMECFDKPIVGEQIEKKRGKLSKRKFRNQLTMIIWSREAEKHIKVKLFRTGRAQMTGVRSEKNGQDCIHFIRSILNRYAEHLNIKDEVVWMKDNWRIAMMNGDLDLKMTISREFLHSILCPKYGITSNLDADTYPGVIMKHVVDTKQITISVFSSGKVIITGANARSQIEFCSKLVHFLCSQLTS